MYYARLILASGGDADLLVWIPEDPMRQAASQEEAEKEANSWVGKKLGEVHGGRIFFSQTDEVIKAVRSVYAGASAGC